MTDDAVARAGVFTLAIQEGIRALQEQSNELAQIRSRTVELVGLTATASAFLIGASLDGGDRGLRFFIPAGLGTAMFTMVLIFGWLILKPVEGWRAKINPTILIDDFGDGEAGLRALAGFYDDAQLSNERALHAARQRMSRALVFAGAAVLTWIALAWLVA